MNKRDFYFDLPPERIAQSPANPRDSARLLCLSRDSGTAEHHIFHQLPDLLRPGDLLVVNNSKVLPARLVGEKRDSGGLCELLLLRQIEGDDWECLAKPGRRIRPGMMLEFGDKSLVGEVLETLDNGSKVVRFYYDTQTLYEKLDAMGQMPLPHYIQKQLENNEDYQTVYAKNPGSAAAPTAGLHFTPELMQQLRQRGIDFAELTLHVGLGTFRPVKSDDIKDHQMHSEWYCIESSAAHAIQNTKKSGGRVIAVGTTSCRTLESVYRKYGKICPASGETDIFIYPGSTIGAIDGLLTNFHLPESTLIMLVSAFYGRERTLQAYQEAIQLKYNFYSFGDVMLIL